MGLVGWLVIYFRGRLYEGCRCAATGHDVARLPSLFRGCTANAVYHPVSIGFVYLIFICFLLLCVDKDYVWEWWRNGGAGGGREAPN